MSVPVQGCAASRRRWVVMLCSLASFALGSPGRAFAATRDLGDGFRDHGAATASSNSRGVVATVDAQGRDVVLIWLMDHRGGYELLLVDVDSGKSEEYPLPFPLAEADSPYASLLSRDNRYYTHFGSHFLEFDVAARAFTFDRATSPQMAMSLTEDASGVIWSATYPHCGVVSFDPHRRVLRDYGPVYRQNWAQYPRFIACDDTGWVYLAVGNTASQLVAFHPAAGPASGLLADPLRQRGMAYVYPDENGRVYGQARHDPASPWFELYGGLATALPGAPPHRPRPVITGDQTLFHRRFPDGRTLLRCDPLERELVVAARDGVSTRRVPFDYHSDGAIVMGVAAAPDGSICGGTTFPMRFFRFDPATDTWTHRPAYGQWNAVLADGPRFYAATYGGGGLLVWDPTRPWVNTEPGRTDANPRLLTSCDPTLHRPTRLVADQGTVIMAGTPEYGYTGGGLLFWDVATGSGKLLTDAALIPDQSTLSLVRLPDGPWLGGTTTTPGTGGEKRAHQAELYFLDPRTRKIMWHEAVLPGVQEYTDLMLLSDGTVAGLADRKRAFIFEPTRRAVVKELAFPPGLADGFYQQGPRAFVRGPDGSVYLLMRHGIFRCDRDPLRLTLLARTPVPVDSGGAGAEGRLYFASGSHLCSYELPGRDTGAKPQPAAASLRP